MHDGAQRSVLGVMQQLLAPRDRPLWFDASVKVVLEGADVVMSARGPRELEQMTAELLGAELHRAVHEEHRGLWLAWWFEELVGAATTRIEEDAGGSTWEPPFWLLHGLASIGTPALQSSALAALSRVEKGLRRDAGMPEWLREAPRVTATGDVVRMRDAYGTRFAVIAGFSYGDGRDSSVFLFDIDVSGFVTLVDAGVFDDTEQAATAWRAKVGDTAEDARAEPVEDPNELLCLVHCDVGDEFTMGKESRAVMDNWFRAQRRIHDLATALRMRGMPMPAAESLYHEVDTTLLTAEFAAWHADRNGAQPDPEAADELATEWMNGAIPETWYAASPQRIDFQLRLINDWNPDHPVTHGVKALMPEWVCWLGERAGLPEDLRERAVTAATSGPSSDPAG